jgi:hypothetical protein
MSALDAVLHFLNFVLPGVLLGCIAAAMTKVVWFRTLKGVPLWRLAVWGGVAAVLASIVGLVATGHDGAVVTYFAMALACAAALMWAGWLRRS